MATRVSAPVATSPNASVTSRNGTTFTVMARKSAPSTVPMSDPRPPKRLAPPSTVAAMLPRANPAPAVGAPTPVCDARYSPARAATMPATM